jgi:hypothetical protein
MGKVLRERLVALEKKHPSVGATRSIGLFGMVELVRSRRSFEPMAPYGGTSDEMAALGRFFRENGLYTFVRWHTFFTNPLLTITEGAASTKRPSAITGARDHDRAARTEGQVWLALSPFFAGIGTATLDCGGERTGVLPRHRGSNG